MQVLKGRLVTQVILESTFEAVFVNALTESEVGVAEGLLGLDGGRVIAGLFEGRAAAGTAGLFALAVLNLKEDTDRLEFRRVVVEQLELVSEGLQTLKNVLLARHF
jgi:hypothetical protein